MSELNYAYAVFDGTGNFTITNRLWQYNYGQKLEISGLTLPNTFEVQFGQKGGSTTKTQIYSDGFVTIPDEFLLSGKWIEAYIYLHAGAEDGETCYKISIPVTARQQPTNQEPTPAQQDVITETIAALNAAVSEVEDMAITTEERAKLSGIEAGAEVNVIEEIKAWDRIRQGYVALPIVNKSVNIPRRADAIVPIPFTLTGDLDDLSVASSISPSDVLNKEYEDDRIEAKLVTGSLFAGRVLLLGSCDSNSVDFSGVINVDDSSITYLYILGDPITDEWYAFVSYIPTVEGVDNALANIVSVPDGGTTNQVLAKASDDDGDLKWVDQSGGGGGTSDYTDLSNKPQINGHTLSGNQAASDLGLAPAGAYVKPSGGIPKTDLASGVQTSLGKADSAYQKPSGGIPATDLASGVIPSVPSASSATPQALGTAAAGTSTDYSRADHVHEKPTYSKGDVGLGNVDNVQQYSATNPPPYPVTSVNGQTGAVTLSIPSTAADVGAVAAAQGVAHAGEFVVVGSDGNITTVTMSVWQGGNYGS